MVFREEEGDTSQLLEDVAIAGFLAAGSLFDLFVCKAFSIFLKSPSVSFTKLHLNAVFRVVWSGTATFSHALSGSTGVAARALLTFLPAHVNSNMIRPSFMGSTP